MLKIKEYRFVPAEDGINMKKEYINLKELEKFGFKYKENKQLPHNSIFEWNDMLEIKGNKEQIYIRAFDKREITIYSTCGIAIDKLYDLIKADLVEKVSD